MQPQNQPRREMITWDEVDRLIDHLIPQFKREFTAMVIITRGGIVPGGLLADAMDITHVLTGSRNSIFYSGDRTPAAPHIINDQRGTPAQFILSRKLDELGPHH